MPERQLKDRGTLREWLQAAPFTLSMSAGFFGFYAHAGVLCALEDEGLTPSAVTGASAGALVVGLWASGRTGSDIAGRLSSLERRDFWDPWPGLGLLRGRKFREVLSEELGAKDMAEARVPCAISVYDIRRRRTLVLRQGRFVDAIQASCALPLLFPPLRVGRELYSDGGILDRPAHAGVGPSERVLHHHLASRSPWRRKKSKALEIPSRANTRSLVILNLPRVSPFTMPRGRDAMNRAYKGTLDALDLQPQPDVA